MNRVIIITGANNGIGLADDDRTSEKELKMKKRHFYLMVLFVFLVGWGIPGAAEADSRWVRNDVSEFGTQDLDAYIESQMSKHGIRGISLAVTSKTVVMSRALTDITILMIVGSVPDYVQGFIKLFWLLGGKAHNL